MGGHHNDVTQVVAASPDVCMYVHVRVCVCVWLCMGVEFVVFSCPFPEFLMFVYFLVFSRGTKVAASLNRYNLLF